MSTRDKVIDFIGEGMILEPFYKNGPERVHTLTLIFSSLKLNVVVTSTTSVSGLHSMLSDCI